MRWMFGLVAFVTACSLSKNLDGASGDDDPLPDGDGINDPPPRLIPGGGVDDGAIRGVLNIFVVDTDSDAPIANADVEVGAHAGVTDAQGLFVVRDMALAGKQTIVARAAGFRAQVYVGANGANVTVPLQRTPVPQPARASMSGTIAGFAGITVTGANHVKAAVVDYSDAENAPAGANDIQSTNNCTANPNPNCAYAVTTRTGKLALMAVVVDVDTRGTLPPNDDTYRVITWAYKTGIDVVASQNQTNHVLTIVPTAQLVAITADLGVAPAGSSPVAVAGVELGADGTAQLPFPLQPGAATMPGPPLSLFPGATYRLTAFATTATTASIALRRGITTPTMAVGTWLEPPPTVAATRTNATFVAPANTVIETVRYASGPNSMNHHVEFTILDKSTTVEMPPSITLPSGMIEAQFGAVRGTLDVTSFSFTNDAAAITDVSARNANVP